VLKINTDLVNLNVRVIDRNNRPINNIRQEDFHVFEDGHAQKISHFASEDVPLELVAAIDISGSMAPAMPKLKSAVKAFLEAVPPAGLPQRR
jgi:VWFA-related protein